MAAHVLALIVDLHLPQPHSLKEKRAIVKTMLEGARHRFGMAAAETDHQDRWQRAELSFVAVSSSATLVGEQIDGLERFLWSFPEAEVLSADRTWMETD